MLLIGYQLVVLRRKLHERVFGSKLTLRLMVVFALMALVPGGLVYAISFQFLQSSIESWFDVRMDKALEGGLNLARNALDNSLQELGQKAEGDGAVARHGAGGRAGDPEPPARAALRRGSHPAQPARQGHRLRRHRAPVSLLPDLPGPNVLRQVRAQQPVRTIE